MSLSFIFARLLAMALSLCLLRVVVGEDGVPRPKNEAAPPSHDTRGGMLDFKAGRAASCGPAGSRALEDLERTRGLIVRHEELHAFDAAFPGRADADDDARNALGLEPDAVEVRFHAGRIRHDRLHPRLHRASPFGRKRQSLAAGRDVPAAPNRR